MSSVRQQTRTLTFDVVLMVVAGFAPAIAMGLAGWSNGVNVAILSGLAVFIACMGGTGWRTGATCFSISVNAPRWPPPSPCISTTRAR